MNEESEFDAGGPERPIRLIRIKEVQYRTGLGRSTIYRWMAQGRFPQTVRIGVHSVAWIEQDVDFWMSIKLAEND